MSIYRCVVESNVSHEVNNEVNSIFLLVSLSWMPFASKFKIRSLYNAITSRVFLPRKSIYISDVYRVSCYSEKRYVVK